MPPEHSPPPSPLHASIDWGPPLLVATLLLGLWLVMFERAEDDSRLLLQANQANQPASRRPLRCISSSTSGSWTT